MTTQPAERGPSEPLEQRSKLQACTRGAMGKCPNCGEGRLFSGGTQIVDQCEICAEELYHHRADDLPAYLNIFVTGHIMVAAVMVIHQMRILDLWVLTGLSCLAVVIMSVLLLRPLKGIVVGAQWAMGLHGFGGHDE